MGKIVKYCSSCDEGFAEKFGFCPDCGAPLQAFELNPISGAAADGGDSHVETHHFEESPLAAETFSSPAELSTDQQAVIQTESYDFNDEVIEEPANVIPVTAAGSYAGDAGFRQEAAAPYEAADSYVPDDGFHVTVIEEKNTKQRNSLLLGATSLMLIALLSGTVYSLFSKQFDIGSIGDGDLFALIPQVDPDIIEIEKPEEKKKDDEGGGGGGKEDPEPAAKGKPPAMMDKPDMAPDVNMDRLTNPTIVPRIGVQGPPQPKIDPYSRYGVLNGLDNNSNGPGTGGGIGTGRGTGVGSGDGSGLGSGSGGGAGDGTGGGTPGGGRTGALPPPPPRPVGVSSPVKILAKPKAPYTDAARQNNVQGSVTLKITFLASGQVGSVTAVSRLPYGLTENAIAAAKQIRFEPKKVNGVPVSTTMTFQYGFNIY